MNKYTPSVEPSLTHESSHCVEDNRPRNAEAPDPVAVVPTRAPLPRRSIPAVEPRYFRCERLFATLSAAQCQANRAKLSYRDSFVLPDGPPPDVQPWQCSSCGLALRMDRGGVAFFNAEEVLAGRARLASRVTSGGLYPAA